MLAFGHLGEPANKELDQQQRPQPRSAAADLFTLGAIRILFEPPSSLEELRPNSVDSGAAN